MPITATLQTPLFAYKYGFHDKEAFDVYMKTGSLRKARDYMRERYGMSITHQCIKNRFWKYICDNQDESFDTVSKFLRTEGRTITRDEWNIEIAANARYAYPYMPTCKKWLEDNGLYETYVKVLNGELHRPRYDSTLI